MAITATQSPKFYSGPNLELDTYRAVDTQTWKAGQWCYLSSTGKVLPLATQVTRVLGIFADSQATATSTSNVKVYKIPSTECKFYGYVSNAGNDTTAQLTHIGEFAGAAVASNVMTVSVSNDTETLFKIVDCLYRKEAFKNVSTDSPGLVIFSVKNDSTLQG